MSGRGDLRAGIVAALPPFQDGYLPAEDVADKLIDVLRDHVRPLEWEELPDGGCAALTRGFYYVTRSCGNLWRVIQFGNPVCSVSTNREIAKAKAYLHHKAQVLEYLGVSL